MYPEETFWLHELDLTCLECNTERGFVVSNVEPRGAVVKALVHFVFTTLELLT
jgi:hypothetical protein